jgi:hypothetical protein
VPEWVRNVMFQTSSVMLLLRMLALGACAATLPAGASVLVVPPEGKNLAQFQQEDATCRGYALRQIGYGSPQQAANGSAIGSAAVGTVLGAAVGAALGAAVGEAGTGAAIGVGTGLLVGSATGANTASASALALQQGYDIAYAQCMAASGDHVQGYPVAWLYGPCGYPYAYPAYYSPWFGPAVTLGFFGRVGPGFHHGFSIMVSTEGNWGNVR